jgi:hypothetical protein
VSLCLEATTIVGEDAGVGVDEDVGKTITMLYLEETTLITRWMSWFRSGRSHHRAVRRNSSVSSFILTSMQTYREVGFHHAVEEDG